jgi:hypothetical protein
MLLFVGLVFIVGFGILAGELALNIIDLLDKTKEKEPEEH